MKSVAKSGIEEGVAVIVLAAGKGTRMKSARAKVLHDICGVPMLGHIQRIAESLDASRLIVVVGLDADEVQQAFGGQAEFVLQAEQKGTGHAAKMAMPRLSDFSGDVLILYGDTPLLRDETLARMRTLKHETGAALVMLTATADIPGRVLRDAHGRVERVIEAQDATDEELAIEERNTGVYLVSAPLLREGLENIDAHNQQGELYITDVVGYAVAKGHVVEALWLRDGTECLGINTRAELANAGSIMRGRINARLMSSGVTLIDPDNTYIDADVQIGRDTIIEPGCHITGRSVIGEAVHIKAGCYIEDSRLDDRVIFGPFSHLRPNCHLMRGVKIGNFVEVKNSTIGEGSKSAHLTYIGDADVGAGVNFGCGSVVVNYDGYEKHRTVVGDEAFVGCNVNLLSPVEIEPKAFLAAGSTISQRVPTDALGVARARQRNIEGWVARKEGRAAPRSRSGAGSAVRATSGRTERVAAKPSAGGSKPGGKKKVTNVKKKGTKKKAAKGRPAKKKATRKKVAKKRVAKKKVAKKKAAKRGTVKKKAVHRKSAKKRRR